MAEYVLDTYAAIEYLRGSRSYLKAINLASRLYTNQFMLTELYFISLKRNGEEIAEKHFTAFAQYSDVLAEVDLKNAMKKRLEMKQKRLDVSYADSLGYQQAVKKNVKFLTGDPAFKNEPHTEFIP